MESANAFLKTNNKLLLTSTQRKSLSVALKLLEERLFHFRLMLEHGSNKGVLYHLRVDLSANTSERFLKISDEILSNIQALKKKFDLQTPEEKLSNWLMGSATYLWTVLEDEKSRKLKRYGQVNRNLKEELDPMLQNLIDLLQSLVKSE